MLVLPLFLFAAKPSVAVKFVILIPIDSIIGTPVSVTIEAQKSNNQVDANYESDVALLTSGSATGAGLVNIVNGVGTLLINDLTPETVTLSLSDTQVTGLNISSTQLLTFTPSPEPPKVSWNQQGFWFRDDDGSEMTATGFGAENINRNTNIINVISDTFLRLRFAVKLDQADSALIPQLEFKEGADCTTGSWTSVASGGSDLKLHLSNNIIDGSATTQQLVGGPKFTPGSIFDGSNPGSSLAMTKNQSTELEWSLQTTPNTPSSTTYSFRITNADTALDIYGQCPSLTTQALPPSPVCGNGNLETGEQCDAGSLNGPCPSTCSLSCATNSCIPPPTCGNGMIEVGEQCDESSANGTCPAACSASCTTNSCTQPPICGNDILETGEQCDSGSLNGSCPSICSSSCTSNSCTLPPSCGNSTVEVGEQCDAGSLNGSCPSYCSNSCATNSCTPSPVCGNGNLESGEQCDAGFSNGSCPSACSLSCATNSCTSTPSCGNGIVEAPEQCDESGANGSCPSACSPSCTTNSCTPPPTCGNTMIEVGEQCDAGIANGSCPSTCSLSCRENFCRPTPISVGEGMGTIRPTTVSFSGVAFPQAKIILIDRDSYLQKITSQETYSRTDGSFNITSQSSLQSQHSFGLIIKDKAGRTAQTRFFTVNPLADDLNVRNLIVSPTIDLSDHLVTRGFNTIVIGSATPNSSVAVVVDGTIIGDPVKVNNDGNYKAIIPTGNLDFGDHSVRVKQVSPNREKESNLSLTSNLLVSRVALPKADFNNDGKVDIKDQSILLSRWSSKNPEQKKTLDFNGDGRVDLGDLSIFLRSLRNK